MPKRDWRSWHLVAIFAVGTVITWLGEQLKDWAGERLKQRWFPGDGEKS